MAFVNEPGVEEPNTNIQNTIIHAIAIISNTHKTDVTRAFNATFLIFRF